MASNARGSHVSPGIYSKEIDQTYSVKSLGITSLGVVGETLQGPAFEPIEIENWATFKSYFGGTSTEKFAGTNYPKYELPYIAKSYLTESNRLTVCRILGFSGYNAGKAWLLCADGEDGKQLVAVLRSRGHYEKYARQESDRVDECGGPIYKYDSIQFDCDRITISRYTSLMQSLYCDEVNTETSEEDFAINANNYGMFALNAYKNGVLVGSYGVSLNAGTKNYILDVLGGRQEVGDAPIFVEELYDVALEQAITAGKADKIYAGEKVEGLVENSDEFELDVIENEPIVPIGPAVTNNLIIPEDQLTRKNLSQRYLAEDNSFKCHFIEEDKAIEDCSGETETGYVYVVKQFNVEGKKKYYYVPTGEVLSGENETFIFNAYYDRYFTLKDGVVTMVSIDMNDYKEQYRCAVTPWIVSEIKGDGKNIDLKKLFRFYTISDGNNANTHVKISIQNILPDEGLFDVLVRDYGDSDGNPTILERYSRCNMIPGSSNFIGYKIGTVDGEYAIKSKYVTVEVIANEVTAECVPAGFLGYPIRNYDDFGIKAPELKYNCDYDEEIKTRKQYFGMSDLVGVDVDVLTYKGVNAYSVNAPLTNGFHLDSNVSPVMDDNSEFKFNITVDGAQGYTFATVSPLNVTDEYANPTLIGTEEEMSDTIFADVTLRKFTVYPYGGFDGWDIYRDRRTNTDEYKANKYKGSIINGVGENFTYIKDGEAFDLSGKCLTTDYYAYLAAYRQFANREAVDINLFATPGIDNVNQKLLMQDVIDMVEDVERMDALYVFTTPDKPAGASDSILEMYSAEEVVENLTDSDIDTSYGCTFYPWVKYLDTDADSYIMLPVTKDILRDFAKTDNESFSWYASAGVNRGMVSCISAHKALKLAEEDVLYEGRINPVKTFAQDGVKIWGNKTAYLKETPLNRINTRRLMLRIQKLINGSVKGLLFDPNDNTVANQFKGIVNDILGKVKANRGISDYYVTVDTSAEARDRHELPATIGIRPIGALEYIDITYYVTPEGVSWED